MLDFKFVWMRSATSSICLIVFSPKDGSSTTGKLSWGLLDFTLSTSLQVDVRQGITLYLKCNGSYTSNHYNTDNRKLFWVGKICLIMIERHSIRGIAQRHQIWENLLNEINLQKEIKPPYKKATIYNIEIENALKVKDWSTVTENTDSSNPSIEEIDLINRIYDDIQKNPYALDDYVVSALKKDIESMWQKTKDTIEGQGRDRDWWSTVIGDNK